MEIYGQQLTNLLEAEGHQVKFFSVKADPNRNKYKAFLQSFFSIKYYRLIKREIEIFNPDIVHAHSFSNIITPSFLIAVKRMGLPVVVTAHGFGPWTRPHLALARPQSIVSWIRFWLHMKIVKRYLDILECPSRALAKHLISKLGIDCGRVAVNPRPIDWPEPKEVRYNSTGNICYIGRLSELKGIEYLIQAMPKVSGRHPGARLHIIGEGGIRQDLEDLANGLNIGDKVVFHGYIPHEDLVEIYSKADIVVLPSTHPESFGLTLIEAMSQKVPVITTNIGGQAELVEPGVNGFLVSPMDAEDLAGKICIILSNPELAKEMGENGRKIVERDYTPEKHLSKILEIYKSLVTV